MDKQSAISATHLLQNLLVTSTPFASHATGEPDTIVEEEIYRDIYSFGELLLEILTNGRLITAGGSIQSKPRDTILREIYDENEGGVAEESREEIKLVLEVAVLCTRSMPSDRPSMEDALRLLSGLRPHRKQ